MIESILEKIENADKSTDLSEKSIEIIYKIDDNNYFGFDCFQNLCFIMSSIEHSPQTVKTDKIELELNHNYFFDHSDNEIRCNIIKLLSNEPSELKPFIKLSLMFLEKNQNVSSEEVYDLFIKFKDLFNQKQDVNKLQMIGLIGELVFIKYIYDKYNVNLVKYYRKRAQQTHDFELSYETKVEVKTTTSNNRNHKISHHQLFPGNRNVYIASVLVFQEDKGITLSELYNDIEILFNRNFDIKYSIEKEVQQYKNITQDFSFDIQKAYDEIKLFLNKKLQVMNNTFPDYVININYTINLNNIDKILEKDFLKCIQFSDS